MSAGKPMEECTNHCGTPVVRRGMCPVCAAQRREAAVVAHQRIAEIRVECRVELPQHVEPVAPVRTREVERLTLAPLPKRPEKPAKAPKPVRAAPDMPVAVEAPVAPLRLDVVTVAPKGGKPRREVELDPDPKPGRCRILGCGRALHVRGLCGGCYWIAKDRGLGHLMLPPRSVHPAPGTVHADRARIVALLRERPGLRPVDAGKMLELPKSSVRWHLGELVEAGTVVRDHRGAYRVADADPLAPVAATDRLMAILRPVGTMRICDAQKALGIPDASFRAAVKNLRLRGDIARPGPRATWGWLRVAS